MSKKKDNSLNINKKLIIVGGIFVISLGMIAFVAHVIINKAASSHMSQFPDVQTLTGKITGINNNGRDYVIDENGHKVPGPSYGIADAGDSITVDGQTFSTSNGNGAVKDNYYIDIKSINLGDVVTVNYAMTDSGGKTLNCEHCSISKN